MPISLVSLDMAGTTFDDDNRVYSVLRSEVSRAADTDVPDDLLRRWTGTSKPAAVRGMLAELGSDRDPDVVYAAFEAELDRQYRDRPPLPFPGVDDLFARLRAGGTKIALQTGYGKEVTQLLLNAAGWSVGDQLDAVVTSDEVAASRPAPYMIFRTMERTGVTDVREVLVAGDTPNDLLAGWRAGAGFVVAVLSGAHSAEELGRSRHTHLLPSVLGIDTLEE